MVGFCLKGHTLVYDVQTMLQVFYPNSNYYEVEEIQMSKITVISELTDKFAYGAIYFDGELKCEKKCTIIGNNTNIKEKKRLIKLSLYLCLKEVTRYDPKWGIVTGIRPAKVVNELIDLEYDENFIKTMLMKDYLAREDKADLAIAVAKAERDILSKNKKGDFSLYIGIPFCPTRCLYCSFTSYPLDKYKNIVDLYLDKLIEELEFVSDNVDKNKLMTIYMGGGTPTSLNEAQLERLLRKVNNLFDAKNILEYSVEAGRPDTITKEKLNIMKENHVSRISINPQTMNPKTLEIIGRQHSIDDVRQVYTMAKEMGFDNINMDLILGLPGEKVEEVELTMKEILKLNPASLTVHTLAIKRASRLKENLDDYSFVNIELMEEMLKLGNEYANKMSMKPYYMYRQKNTIGNFENIGYCKAGYECIYNVEIMEEKQTIIAVGAGSTSKIYDCDINHVSRIFNVKSVEDYLSRFDEMVERKVKGIFCKS